MSERASDPGKWLSQYLTEGGHPIWLRCPKCDGPARDTRTRVACTRCGYNYGARETRPRAGQQVRLLKWSPSCANPKCGAPIPDTGRAIRPIEGEQLMATVQCPTCKHSAVYPAVPFASNSQRWRIRYMPYLSREIDGNTLWVYNLQHLDALEQWLGATLRERGPVRGMTMMARLPRWMKAASARPKIVKALAEMRAEAEREGIA